MVDGLKDKREAIAELVARHGVASTSSAPPCATTSAPARATSTCSSSLPPHGYALVDAHFGLLDDLRTLLGAEADLLMADAVRNRYVAREIERTKQLLSAA